MKKILSVLTVIFLIHTNLLADSITAKNTLSDAKRNLKETSFKIPSPTFSLKKDMYIKYEAVKMLFDASVPVSENDIKGVLTGKTFSKIGDKQTLHAAAAIIMEKSKKIKIIETSNTENPDFFIRLTPDAIRMIKKQLDNFDNNSYTLNFPEAKATFQKYKNTVTVEFRKNSGGLIIEKTTIKSHSNNKTQTFDEYTIYYQKYDYSLLE